MVSYENTVGKNGALIVSEKLKFVSEYDFIRADGEEEHFVTQY